MLFIITLSGLLLCSIVAAFAVVALVLGTVFALISFGTARPPGVSLLNKNTIYILCGLGLILLFLVLQVVSLQAFKTLAFSTDLAQTEYLLAGKTLLFSAGIQGGGLMLCSHRVVSSFFGETHFAHSGIRFTRTQLFVLLAAILCMLITGLVTVL